MVSKMADIWDIGRWEHQPSTNKLKEHGLLQLNCEKAYRYFGWRSVWDFDSTIAETVEWYKKYTSRYGNIDAALVAHPRMLNTEDVDETTQAMLMKKH